jgi:hypothetical protein
MAESLKLVFGDDLTGIDLDLLRGWAAEHDGDPNSPDGDVRTLWSFVNFYLNEVDLGIGVKRAVIGRFFELE